MKSQQLKRVGLKVTVPRLRILQVLESSDKIHFSAEDVYKALLDMKEDVSLATIYRVLTQFERAGLVCRHKFEEGRAVFELANSEHHDHMVCIDTGKIIEFQNEFIEKAQTEIANAHGYELVDHTLVLYVKKKANKPK